MDTLLPGLDSPVLGSPSFGGLAVTGSVFATLYFVKKRVRQRRQRSLGHRRSDSGSSSASSTDSKVFVNLDNCVADFEDGVLNRLRVHHPTMTRLPLRSRTTSDIISDYQRRCGDESAKIVKATTEDPAFFSTLRPIPGVIDALMALVASGVEVGLFAAPCAQQEKSDWVDKHLGSKWLERLIFTDDVSSLDCTWLVDARPTIEEESASWTHVLYDLPYNRSVKSSNRLHSWDDFSMLELAKPAAEVGE
eukprot:c2973_g1_i1.p1 GENE.c2973_g1_i1~~c2973_g1_i1.p1  ORF type:complete len:268 (+),score=38.30 c2973_g1_i1:60-806(+)